MKDKQSSSWEEDTEGMIEWRSVSQEEMDKCWKELAENRRRGFGQVQGGRQQREVLTGQRFFFGMEACAKKQEVHNTKVERKLLGKNLRFVQRIQPAASAKHA